MREDPRWARAALLLNLAGTILLALSFQATSSALNFVTGHDVNIKGQSVPGSKTFLLCYGNDLIAGADSTGYNAYGGYLHCGQSNDSKPAAVVNAEHPWMLFAGLILSAVGFFLQFLIIPPKETLAVVNESFVYTASVNASSR